MTLFCLLLFIVIVYEYRVRINKDSFLFLITPLVVGRVVLFCNQ